MVIRAIDLFCGAGGLTCGLKQAGIKVAAGIDIDSTCKYAYEHNNKAVFLCEDIGKIDINKLNKFYKKGDIKLLAGCAPCQPFSSHQKNKSDRTHHNKWGLLYEFSKKVEQLNPDLVSMENVPELEKEIVFIDFVNKLKELGYHVSYKVVNAADYGVPQRRKRLLLLGSKFGDISLIPYTHVGKHKTVRDAIGFLEPLQAGECSVHDPMHRCSSLSATNLLRIQYSTPGGTWRDWPNELIPNCYKKETGKSYGSVYGRVSWDGISPTLTTQFIGYGTGRYGHPEQDRALSLREGALIQTFPLSYSFIEEGKPVVIRDVARQIGNAVPVRLGEIIGISIKRHMREFGGAIHD